MRLKYTFVLSDKTIQLDIRKSSAASIREFYPISSSYSTRYTFARDKFYYGGARRTYTRVQICYCVINIIYLYIL